MKYSKEELINTYANKLMQNKNFVNHWMGETFSFYDCYNALMVDTNAEREYFAELVKDCLMARAVQELNVLLVGFDVEQTDGYYNWTDERYNQVCRWLDELTECEECEE